eukprot:2099775-Alexandrium_andersonii.AAC.1
MVKRATQTYIQALTHKHTSTQGPAEDRARDHISACAEIPTDTDAQNVQAHETAPMQPRKNTDAETH